MKKKSALLIALLLLSFIGSVQAAYYVEDNTALYLQLDEGEGTTAKDVSSYRNDGTLSGPLWVDGIYGTALSFDGINDIVAIPDSPELQQEDAFSIEAWVKFDSFIETQIRNTLISKGTNYRLFWFNSTKKFAFSLNVQQGGNVFIVISKTVPVINTWYHVVGVYDGVAGISIYVNGQLEKTVPVSGFITIDTSIVIIGATSTSTDMLNGTIDEVLIHEGWLTPEQVRHHYTGLPRGIQLAQTEEIWKATSDTIELLTEWDLILNGDFEIARPGYPTLPEHWYFKANVPESHYLNNLDDPEKWEWNPLVETAYSGRYGLLVNLTAMEEWQDVGPYYTDWIGSFVNDEFHLKYWKVIFHYNTADYTVSNSLDNRVFFELDFYDLEREDYITNVCLRFNSTDVWWVGSESPGIEWSWSDDGDWREVVIWNTEVYLPVMNLGIMQIIFWHEIPANTGYYIVDDIRLLNRDDPLAPTNPLIYDTTPEISSSRITLSQFIPKPHTFNLFLQMVTVLLLSVILINGRTKKGA